MRNAVLITAMLGLLAGGCGGRQGAEVPEELDSEGYGALPGLKKVPDRKLRDELARIIEEGATPEPLCDRPAPDDQDDQHDHARDEKSVGDQGYWVDPPKGILDNV